MPFVHPMERIGAMPVPEGDNSPEQLPPLDFSGFAEFESQATPIIEYRFDSIESFDAERAEIGRLALKPDMTKEDFEIIRQRGQDLGMTVDDIMARAAKDMDPASRAAWMIYRNAGPIGRELHGSVRRASGLITNLAYRGLSNISGMEHLATVADKNVRRNEVADMVSDTLNREGIVGDFMGPTAASLMGTAAGALGDLVLLRSAAPAARGQTATKVAATYYGLKEGDKALTAATDAGLSPEMRLAHAGVMSGTSAGLTILFGRFAEKYGVATAEEATIAAGPAVSRLMQRNGLTEAAKAMAFEGAEESSISLSQQLWGAEVAGTDTMDDVVARTTMAGATGAAVRGSFDVPPAVAKFYASYTKTQADMPDTVLGTMEAKKAVAEGRDANIPENASPAYKAAVISELEETARQEKIANEVLAETRVGDSSYKQLIDDLDVATKERANLSTDTENVGAGMLRKDLDFRIKEIEQALGELTDLEKTAINAKIIERVERDATARDIRESQGEFTRAQNSTADALRETLGLSALPEADHTTTIESGRRAIEKGIPERAREIADEVLTGTRIMDSDTQNGLVIRQHKDTVKIQNLIAERDSTDDPKLRSAIQQQIDPLVKDADAITRALRFGGTETARTLAMRRYSFIDNLAPAAVPTTGAKAKGSELTPEESDELVTRAVDVANVEEARDGIDVMPPVDTTQAAIDLAMVEENTDVSEDEDAGEGMTDAEILVRAKERLEAEKSAKTLESTTEGEFLKQEILKARATNGGPLSDTQAAKLVATLRKQYDKLQRQDVEALAFDLATVKESEVILPRPTDKAKTDAELLSQELSRAKYAKLAPSEKGPDANPEATFLVKTIKKAREQKGGPLGDTEAKKLIAAARKEFKEGPPKDDPRITTAALKLATHNGPGPNAKPAKPGKILTSLEFIERELARAEKVKIGRTQAATSEGVVVSDAISRAKKAKGGALTEEEALRVIKDARELYKYSEDVNNLDRARSQDAYDELDMAADKMRSRLEAKIQDLEPRTFLRFLAGANNFARGFYTGGDLIPAFRQGLTHMYTTVKNAPLWLRIATDEKQLFLAERAMRQREYAKFGEDAGLATGLRENQYELFSTNFLRNFAASIHPGLGKLVPNFQKANNFLIRKIRADAFDAHVRSLGGPGKVDKETAKRIARFENTATGYGTLAGFEASSKQMSQLFIGPRFWMSRLEYMTFIPLMRAAANGDKAAVKVMSRMYAQQVIGLALMTQMAQTFGQMAFGEDEVKFFTNPADSNFGRLRVGKTMIDITGGLARPYRYFNSLTDPVRAKLFNRRPLKDAGKSAVGIATSALAPLPGAPIAAGSAYLNDTPWTETAGKYLLPWSTHDAIKAFQEEGVEKGAAIALLSIFGAGGYTSEKPPK